MRLDVNRLVVVGETSFASKPFVLYTNTAACAYIHLIAFLSFNWMMTRSVKNDTANNTERERERGKTDGNNIQIYEESGRK